MSWTPAWSLPLPGFWPTVRFDAPTQSLFVGDQVGVPFDQMRLRRVDAGGGRVLAEAINRYGSPRSLCRTADGGGLLSVNDQKIQLHDATTLELRLAFRRRIPRFAGCICDLGEQRVALGTPGALFELDLAGDAQERIGGAVELLQGYAGEVVCLLADGTVLARDEQWRQVGRFAGPVQSATLDPERGLLAVLLQAEGSGARPLPGLPSAGPGASERVQLASLDEPWRPRTLRLRRPAHAIRAFRGAWLTLTFAEPALPSPRDARVCRLAVESLEPLARSERVPGQFVGVAGAHGILVAHETGCDGRTASTLSLVRPAAG